MSTIKRALKKIARKKRQGWEELPRTPTRTELSQGGPVEAIDAVLINTNHDAFEWERPKFEQTTVTASHAIFTSGTTSQISTLIGIPLKVLSLRPDPLIALVASREQGSSPTSIVPLPENSNTAAAYLQTDVNPYSRFHCLETTTVPLDSSSSSVAQEALITGPIQFDNHLFGTIPYIWQHPGPVLVVRADAAPLHAFHVEAISYFCEHHISFYISKYLTQRDSIDPDGAISTFTPVTITDANTDTDIPSTSPTSPTSTTDPYTTPTTAPIPTCPIRSALSYTSPIDPTTTVLSSFLPSPAAPRPQNVLLRITPSAFRDWYADFLAGSIAGRPQWGGEAGRPLNDDGVVAMGGDDELEAFEGLGEGKGEIERQREREEYVRQLGTYTQEQVGARPWLRGIASPFGRDVAVVHGDYDTGGSEGGGGGGKVGESAGGQGAAEIGKTVGSWYDGP